MENKGYIREGDEMTHVQVEFPEPTKRGLEFLESDWEQTFNVYPEAYMLLPPSKAKSFSSFSGRGQRWADPDIRRQRLGRMGANRKPRKSQKPRTRKPIISLRKLETIVGRMATKLSKRK